MENSRGRERIWSWSVCVWKRSNSVVVENRLRNIVEGLTKGTEIRVE